MDYAWTKADEAGLSFNVYDRESGATVYRATRNDLVSGSNTRLRSVAEPDAGRDGLALFVRDFVRGWDRAVMADR